MKKILPIYLELLFFVKISFGQSLPAPVVFEAESGTIGVIAPAAYSAEWLMASGNGVTMVTNLDNSSVTLTPPTFSAYNAFATQLPIATGKNKFLGCAHSNVQAVNFTRYFNQVTPENGGKWGNVEVADNVFRWTAVDSARALAKRNGFVFRYHTLVWGAQQPTWLKPMTNDQKVYRLKRWFQAVANHFDGSSDARAVLDYLEVVNEALMDPPNNIGANATDNGSGNYVDALKSLNTELNTAQGRFDWVVNAFKLARKYFPSSTKLVLNDYGVENNTDSMRTYVKLVNMLKAQNLVDIVGMQGHGFSTMKYSAVQSYASHTAFLRSNLDMLASTRVPIQITEMDINGDTGDDNQKAEFQRVFGLYWNHPSVMGITLWGYLNGMWRSQQQCYLVNPNTNAERPALRDYLNNTFDTVPTSVRASTPPLSTSFLPSISRIPANTIVKSTADVPAANANAVLATAYNCPGVINITVADVRSAGNDSITRTWTVTDACGNTQQARQIIVIDSIAPIAPALADITSSCPVTPVAPKATDNILRTVTGTCATSFPISAIGTTTITWMFRDSAGNSSSANQNIIIANTAPVIRAGQTFSIAENVTNGSTVGTLVATDDVCQTLQNWTITGGTGVSIFAINAATGALTVSNNSAINYETTTSYTLTVHVSDGIVNSADETVTVQITNVNEAPVAHFTSSVTSGNVPLTVLFTSTSTDADAGDVLTYAWEFGDQQTGSGSSVNHDYTQAGTFTVRLTVTDLAGLTNSTTQTITVIPSTYAGSVSKPGLKVYPNPSVGGRFTIELGDIDVDKATILQIVSSNGEEAVQQKVTEKVINVDQNLSPGIYIIKITSKSGVFVEKLLVQ